MYLKLENKFIIDLRSPWIRPSDLYYLGIRTLKEGDEGWKQKIRSDPLFVKVSWSLDKMCTHFLVW